VSGTNRVIWDGLDELKAALQALPETCAGEAAKLIEGTANAAYVAIKGAYPSRSGKLRAGLKLLPITRRGLIVGQKIVNTSKYAAGYDHGTQARHYVSAGGATHRTGIMGSKTPPTHVFGKTIQVKRRQLTASLVDLLKRQGATVSGDA